MNIGGHVVTKEHDGERAFVDELSCSFFDLTDTSG